MSHIIDTTNLTSCHALWNFSVAIASMIDITRKTIALKSNSAPRLYGEAYATILIVCGR